MSKRSATELNKESWSQSIQADSGDIDNSLVPVGYTYTPVRFNETTHLPVSESSSSVWKKARTSYTTATIITNTDSSLSQLPEENFCDETRSLERANDVVLPARRGPELDNNRGRDDFSESTATTAASTASITSDITVDDFDDSSSIDDSLTVLFERIDFI